MANSYSWVIEWMNTSTQTINGFSQVVLNCGWRCNGTSSQTYVNQQGQTVPYTASIYGTCSFPVPATGDSSFIPYANLTEATVLSWVWQNGIDKTAIQAAIDNQLKDLIYPPIVQDKLPWA